MSVSESKQDSSDALYGIDDADFEAKVRRECYLKEARIKRIFVLACIILGSGLVSGIAAAALNDIKYAGYIATGIVTVAMMLVIGKLESSLWRKWFPGVAAKHDLCANCGYRRHGVNVERCPECGTKFDLQQESNDQN